MTSGLEEGGYQNNPQPHFYHCYNITFIVDCYILTA